MVNSLRTQFETDGYAVIEDFITPSQITELKNQAEHLIQNMPEVAERTIFSTTNSEKSQNIKKYFMDSADKISYFFENDAVDQDGNLRVDPNLSLNKIGHALHELDPVFRKLTLSEKVKEVAFQLGYKEPVVPQSMYIFKNPGIGSEVVPHQDAWYLYTEPMSVVGFWIALDDATIENGCLWIAKGSHKSGVHRRYIRNPDRDSEDLNIYDKPAPIYQRSTFTAVPVPKGSLVLIHGQVVHLSEVNKSQKSRHAYAFHVVEQENTKYVEENWLQSPRPFVNLYTSK